jgi:hypothetical protein
MDRLAIQQIGGSLYFRLPAYFWRKHHIEAGDLYDLIVNADGSIIKLIKADDMASKQEKVDAA